jgi:CheY-like chemotaxis protein
MITTKTGTILIADDDVMWARSMARLLENEGYRVLWARSGVDALYQARMRRPDLILLDPNLAQLSGWEVCRRLKRSPEMARVKIVLLTLQGEAAYRARADGYLVKGGQVEPTLPPVRVFRHPVQGILEDFVHRRAMAA